MGGTLSNKRNNNGIGVLTTGDNAGSLQMSRMDWRDEVVRHYSKHHNPQMRQLNYERNINAYESVLKELSEKESKTYYQICKDYFLDLNTFG
ncbi:unnamed protein product [Macrosiphum euphorbiae]|uniref:Uncharacterized protein n=1 Tax=Macrosiphum euphorbiae TaxID=13131 RepID=A0AAV0VI65_9HEMI|nr:unnamed protein product [Macrosiphum euphorbiae]